MTMGCAFRARPHACLIDHISTDLICFTVWLPGVVDTALTCVASRPGAKSTTNTLLGPNTQHPRHLPYTKTSTPNTHKTQPPQHVTHTCMVTRNTCYALHLTWHRSMPICSYVFMVKCWFGGRCSSSAPPKLASRVKLLFVNCLHAT